MIGEKYLRRGAGTASITVGEAAGEEQHMLPPAHKQDARLFPTSKVIPVNHKNWAHAKLQLAAGHSALFLSILYAALQMLRRIWRGKQRAA